MRAIKYSWSQRKYNDDVVVYSGDDVCNCCGSSYFNKINPSGIINKGTNNGIAIYQNSPEIVEGNEDDGQYITSKVETKNGTMFIKVRTRWLK